MKMPVRVTDSIEVIYEAVGTAAVNISQVSRKLRPDLVTEWLCGAPPEEGRLDSNQDRIYPDVNDTTKRHFFLFAPTGADTCTIYWDAADNVGARNIWATTDNGYQLVTTGIAITNPTTGYWIFFQGEEADDYRVYPAGSTEAVTL